MSKSDAGISKVECGWKQILPQVTQLSQINLLLGPICRLGNIFKCIFNFPVIRLSENCKNEKELFIKDIEGQIER